MTIKSKLIQRYPLLTFFVLSYVFFISAILTIGMKEGKDGVKRLFAGWSRWRVNGWWYAFGLAPISVAIIIAVLYSRLGKADEVQGSAELSTSIFFLMLIFHTIQGASGEELGWRGFALPGLQKRFSPLKSALILGLVISGWHGLLHLVSPTGIPEWQFIVLLVSYSVIITWAGFGRS